MKDEEGDNLQITAIEETKKKVSSSLLRVIDQHVTNNKFDSKKDGLDFLEVKNSVMLSYLIDLTQLKRLQSKLNTNKNEIKVQNCIKRLNEVRVILDKIRPMEKKMRYQLDKLLALSANSSTFAAMSDTNLDVSMAPVVGTMDDSDPLSFRPNPDGLMGKGDGDTDDDNESDSDDDKPNENYNDKSSVNFNGEESGNSSEGDDEDLKAAKAALAMGKSKTSKKKSKKRDDSDNDDDKDNESASTGIYKAPMLAAVPFAEKEKQEEKERKLLKRQRDRMRKSELLQTLKSQFGDKPEEDDFDGGASLGKQREAARRLAEREAEKIRFEEDAMVRLTTSRKEKKMRNRIMRDEVSNLNAIADLGNLTAGVNVAFGSDGFKDDDNDGIVRAGLSRHANGKRRRDLDELGANNSGAGRKGGKRRGTGPKNSYQKALYGMEGGGKKKKK